MQFLWKKNFLLFLGLGVRLSDFFEKNVQKIVFQKSPLLYKISIKQHLSAILGRKMSLVQGSTRSSACFDINSKFAPRG